MFRCQTFVVTILALFLSLLFLSACSHPKIQEGRTQSKNNSNDNLNTSRLKTTSVITSDGYILPIKTWPIKTSLISDKPIAVVLALHGFNDYSNAFDSVAQTFSKNMIITYAFDQRGFGETEQRGIWAGVITMQSDLIAIANLLCKKHSGLPIFLLGESMGGAVILSALVQLQDTCIQGVMLSAPAVWGWQSMPWWQTLPLRALAHTLPELTVTGEGLEIQPSDNIEMLRALGRDPLIIKATRIDAIYGLTNLMDAAMVNSKALNVPALILYGEHDEIIPPASFCQLLENLSDKATSHWRLMLYPDGYHMLTRDLQGEVVNLDMVAWMRDQGASLPSGQEFRHDTSRLSVLRNCD